MSETDERVERLAEILSWAGGEMTRYSPDASPDHNRWSWRGDGHGEWWWGHFRDIAATILAAPEFAEVAARATETALSWPNGAPGRGNATRVVSGAQIAGNEPGDADERVGRLAQEYDTERGYDRPLSEQAERARRLGQGAPLLSPEPTVCGCYACIGNEPAYPRSSWLTVGMTCMIVCALCGNKRCPHSTHHDNPCTGSNEPGQAGSRYPALDLSTDDRTPHERAVAFLADLPDDESDDA